MDIFEVFDKRRSVRKYKKRSLVEDKEKIIKIFEAANSAPSAGNLQSYEIFVLKDDELGDAVKKGCFKQEFIADASVALIFCTNNSRSKYGERGEKLYSIQDATIACAYAQLAATALGFGSVWVGSFDPEKIKGMLEIEFDPVAILIIGYSDEKPLKKPRRDVQDLVHDK